MMQALLEHVDASADVDKVVVALSAGATLPGGEQELRLIFHIDGRPIVWNEVLAETILMYSHGQAFKKTLLAI